MARRIKYFAGQHSTQPIKSMKHLKELFAYLQRKIEKARSEVKRYQADRNYMMVLLGVNTAFRAEDLLQLRVCDVYKGYVSIKENKTGKMQNFRMNKQLHDQIREYCDRWHLTSHDYLFRGQKTMEDGKCYVYPINRQMAYRIVTEACNAVGIDYTVGMHGLRKTFGYHYIKNGGNVITLMKMYNHDSPDVTLLYVCWGKEDAEGERQAFFIGGK